MLYLCVQGEIIEAVISDQWCDAKITKVIPPTQFISFCLYITQFLSFINYF